MEALSRVRPFEDDGYHRQGELRLWDNEILMGWYTSAAWRVAARFLELREDSFVGGLVLRRYERFGVVEARTWWVDGSCVLVGSQPDTPGEEPAGDLDVAAIAPLVAGLGLRFVTVDLARRDDGVWRVVELGDAQVSDRPADLGPVQLIQAVA